MASPPASPPLASARLPVQGQNVTILEESPSLAAGFAWGVSGQIFAVGLALQETAAITVDPLVRRRIEKTLDDLDQVVRDFRDDAFGLRPHSQGHAPPGKPTTAQDGPEGRVPHWLSEAEDGLDAATTATPRLAPTGGFAPRSAARPAHRWRWSPAPADVAR